ncbi:CAP domain-containing protein [Pedococcus bigeumensis]|uniref:CAP domain-containing protein n=2 Tax=Pedococcus bigeumensis TaxID=433644 RepID=A0A502D256_9MICO|nr:CAP domain-containing protein [Pedococcus bigeumensis]
MRTTTPTRARVPPRPRSTPKPSPKPAPKPPSGTGVTGQFLSLVNSERAKAGCGAVRSNSALQRAAQGHSADMAAKNYFSHTSKDGRTFADRIRAAGYGGSTIGENIAAGQSTASAVMRSWLASSGHRANILNCAFTAIGVGYARGGSYGHYWTQDFGG